MCTVPACNFLVKSKRACTITCLIFLFFNMIVCVQCIQQMCTVPACNFLVTSKRACTITCLIFLFFNMIVCVQCMSLLSHLLINLSCCEQRAFPFNDCLQCSFKLGLTGKISGKFKLQQASGSKNAIRIMT